ncbi:hypothetical protein A1O1_02358 [Capronia coronata CBS 617.96]|uniref:Acetyltransferase n=1 Tax=Capronia coronata CBS 617.96 TaxID=1182541 RepID=W9YWC5_9EURO|nr:uncharacterized protein A1O1_02358 [Capronia coronata CBS 617.96]EXJ93965.1 hypothetical protein A1O1_02358 [Capronia coronata CBS 617.96]
MAQVPPVTPGRICLSLVALSTSISCYIADWNDTHVKNPNWPPHARFHNGQTMSMGLSLGLLTAYFTWRPVRDIRVAKDSITTAALVGTLYWATGVSAILYPGTKWVDPEFGEGAPQRGVFLAHAALVWIGRWLELRRLDAAGKTKSG